MAERHGQSGPGVTRMDHHGEQGGDRMAQHLRQTLWVPWTVILLGFWMVAAPLTFSYSQSAAVPAGGRWVWLPLEQRAAAMMWSDIVSGALLVILGWRSLRPARLYSQWAACFVGIWLQFAPFVLWSPSALAYLNDTLVGMLVIALTVLIPGMPGMMSIMKPGPEIPPGWSYNPSSWPQRAIMIALGFAGLLVSRYLAAYQLGYTTHDWDPFFGAGTRRVLTSSMSESWPVSDAALGAFSYTFEFLMGWMGGPSRWRTMPWMVLFFGILVIPLGLTHIVLVISQPVAVGEWCTLCLLAAAIMLPMIPLAVDEVVAMLQFVQKRRQEGDSLWNVFWFGGTVDGGGPDERSPDLADFPEKPGELYRASIWGMSAPWTLSAATVIGLWLMFSPAVLGSAGPFADSSHVAGALVITISVVAMAEVIRIGRFLNVLLGLWLVAAPFLAAGSNLAATVSGVVAGALVIALSIPRGAIRERYGGWQQWVR